ncbi:MAG: RluA family pseudouridine synthase [Christensenellaceae bacterium]|nr:RluA family pseudouridine synthase [Christensenellaceae bacterium]
MEKRVIAKGDRLDKEITDENLSRSQAAKLIVSGSVSVGGKKEYKPSYKTSAGDIIEVLIPKEQPKEILPVDIPINVIYEDEYLAIIEKPAGLICHPSDSTSEMTLVNALLSRFSKLSDIAGEDRRGIVHRLDKETSGIMLIAKDKKSHVLLSNMFKKRQVDKRYIALVQGGFPELSGTIDAPIARSLRDRKKMAVVEGGREAITNWRVIKEYGAKTALEIQIITGRTHQIRVHMAHIHHPVLGDDMYGFKKAQKANRLMLHAWYLSFEHPMFKKRLTYTCKPDNGFLVPESFYDEYKEHFI